VRNAERVSDFRYLSLTLIKSISAAKLRAPLGSRSLPVSFHKILSRALELSASSK